MNIYHPSKHSKPIAIISYGDILKGLSDSIGSISNYCAKGQL
jgi:hypothetical protein